MTLKRLLHPSLRSTTLITSPAGYSRPLHFTRRFREICGGPPPSPTLVNLHTRVRSIIGGGDLDYASTIVHQALAKPDPTLPLICTCNLLMKSMRRAGRYQDVLRLFDLFFKTPSKANGEPSHARYCPNASCYEILVQAYCDVGQLDRALQVLDKMLDYAPSWLNNPSIHIILTKALVSANRLSEAVQLLRHRVGIGMWANTLVYNNVISGYLELNDDVETANKLFDEVRSICRSGIDGHVYVTFMEYYFKRDMDKEAMEYYQRFLDKDSPLGMTPPSTYNVLLEVLLKHGKSLEANSLFDNILSWEKQSFNSQTFSIMVNDCFRLGKVSEALLVFKRRGTHHKTFVIDAEAYNNIIEKLCDIGMVAKANELFNEMLNEELVREDAATFRIIFNACFKEERIDDVLKWFRYLLFETYLKPSSELVDSVFRRLTSNGRMKEAGKILGRMIERHQEPSPTIYKLVFSGLCKGGKVDSIQHLLTVMKAHSIGVPPEFHGIVQEDFPDKQNIRLIEIFLGISPDRWIEQTNDGLQHAPDLQHSPAFQYEPAFQYPPTPPVMNQMSYW